MTQHSNRITAVTRITGFVLAGLFLAVAGARAQSFCFDEAGSEYGINPIILRAIAKVESNFNPRAINRNRNGTYDFGVMQINSNWAYTLGFERWSTLGDACSNIKTGAMILSSCMKKYGYTWEAVGCYNSQTPDKRDRYAQLVFRQLQRIEKEDLVARKNLEAALREKIDTLVAAERDGRQVELNPASPESVPVPPESAQEQPAVPLAQQPIPQDSRDAEITVSSFQDGVAKGM